MMLLPVALAALLMPLLPAVAPQEADDRPQEPLIVERSDPGPVERSDPRPATDEIPLPPPMQLPKNGGTPAPAPSKLPRNGFVVGRFTKQGQQVDYRFEADAGELSLFDFGSWGYARSWHSTSKIEILDQAGTPLLSTRHEGETAYREFIPFVAPQVGSYRLRITAQVEMFRYTLVRHSDYSEVPEGAAQEFGERQAIHGYLAAPTDSRTYALDLRAGQEVALRVANDHPMARTQKDNRRRQKLRTTPSGAASDRGGRGAGQAAGRAGNTARGSRGDGSSGATERGMQRKSGEPPPEDFPDLVLELSHEGDRITEAAHFVLFTPEQSGTHLVNVRATHAGEGGLFVLELVRDPAQVEVTGYIGDEEDDPVAGVSLRFLRQPSSDLVGETYSDEEGEFRMSVLPGKYMVVMGREGSAEVEIVPAAIERARELNLVWVW